MTIRELYDYACEIGCEDDTLIIYSNEGKERTEISIEDTSSYPNEFIMYV